MVAYFCNENTRLDFFPLQYFFSLFSSHFQCLDDWNRKSFEWKKCRVWKDEHQLCCLKCPPSFWLQFKSEKREIRVGKFGWWFTWKKKTLITARTHVSVTHPRWWSRDKFWSKIRYLIQWRTVKSCVLKAEKEINIEKNPHNSQSVWVSMNGNQEVKKVNCDVWQRSLKFNIHVCVGACLRGWKIFN